MKQETVYGDLFRSFDLLREVGAIFNLYKVDEEFTEWLKAAPKKL